VRERELAEIGRRRRLYLGDRAHPGLTGRVAIVVDDGIATGATARAACAVLRAAGAAHIVLAVPVAPSGWQHDLAGVADTYVAVDTPARFGAVGAYYTDFSETSDAQVIDALAARG
jgi:putative phosphoribosyl transferase